MALVLRLQSLSRDLFEISLERAGIEYKCGQWTLLIHSDKVTARAYSFSSHPREQEAISFFFRRQREGFTVWLASRLPGQEVAVGVPSGCFYPGTESREIWVGIGTGIAPFISAIRGSYGLRPLQVLYGARSTDQAPFWSLFENSPAAFLITSDQHSSKDRIKGYKELLLIDTTSHYFLCGVASVVDGLSVWLMQSGIQGNQIHIEAYAS